jgi:hypothetical protein
VVTTNGSVVVDDLSDPRDVRDQFNLAPDAGQAVGGGVLAMCGWDNGLCNAGVG